MMFRGDLDGTKQGYFGATFKKTQVRKNSGFPAKTQVFDDFHQNSGQKLRFSAWFT